MKATEILNNLDKIKLSGEDAMRAARAFYLDWLLHLPAGKTAHAAACDVLTHITTVAPSDATIAFVDYLHQTARTAPHSPKRCGGRTRRTRALN